MKAFVHCGRRWAVVVAMVGALAVGAGVVQAGTIYVSTSGNDGNDGLSWQAAKLTVQAGVNAAAAGDQVWVAAGTYVENITLKADAALYGGFAGSETNLLQRDWVGNPTILDGHQNGSVVTVPQGATLATRIDGFTIRNGNGNGSGSRYGGGIYCMKASAMIANNTITNNTAYQGGGIYCYESVPTISDNMITNNSTQSSGSGIFVFMGTAPATITRNSITGNAGGGYYAAGGGIFCGLATITHNTITGNRVSGVDSRGGGISCLNAATIANNIIAGNSAEYGGGISCFTSVTAFDNVIRSNRASIFGGGIYCSGGSNTVTNCTLVANEAASGAGIACGASSSATILNTIVAHNESGIYRVGTGTVTVRYSCVYGNVAYNCSGLPDPTSVDGNILADPGLTGAAYGDVHLRPDSPCIDAGDSSVVQGGWTDMDGQPRILGSRVDIGADESDGTSWPDVPNVVIRVSSGGNDSNNGTSWALSKQTVQAGIDAAAAAGGEVWVARGTYLERITLRRYVHAYGGFAGGETQRSQRNWSTQITTLDGQLGTVVTATDLGPGASSIDGFVIRNARSGFPDGGGIYCYRSSLVIANNTITSNNLNADNGGGICCLSSSPTIANNTITNNSALSGGGIYYDASSSPTITGNTISGNTANGSDAYGGGIYGDGTGTIANNIIRDNVAGGYNRSAGGGVFSTGPLTLLNNTISGNHAGTSHSYSYGGGVYCYGGPARIQDNTISGNNTTGSYDGGAGGIYCRNAQITVAGNAITNNSGSSDSGGIAVYTSSGSITNNTITGNTRAVYCSAVTSLTIANNTIAGNSGDGIYCSSCSPLIASNMITANTGYWGSGISCYNSSPTIINNTIVGNNALRGAGIHCQAASSPIITNTVIAFNSSGIFKDSGSDTLILRRNCVYGNGEYDYSGLTDPAGIDGNFSADPGIANTVYGNYHLRPDSPCVDAGDDAAIPLGSQDIDGQPRQAGVRVDIGADESDGTAWPSGPNVIVRVRPDGNDADDGSSWAQAKRTVQAAIDAAASGGDVWVAAGTYVGTITLRNHVYVYGGFAGAETQRGDRDSATNVTVLDGSRSGSVVTAKFQGYRLSTIDGFTIRQGTGTLVDTTYYGGGIYCFMASPTITNNQIVDNSATYRGNGIYCWLSSVLVAGNKISNNTAASDRGGGLYCAQGRVTIINNMISLNAANSGAGISCHGCSGTIANNVIVGNSATFDGGGIEHEGTEVSILGNTIVANHATYGGGVYCSAYAGGRMIANTIIAFNSSGIYTTTTGVPLLRNNCVYGNAAYNYSGVADPTGTHGNISVDPRLANVPYGEVHLQPGSPCEDTGDDSLVHAGWQDMDGQPRIAGAHVDIGADESDGTLRPEGPNVIVRVSPAGDDANDGASWPLAKRTVQAGIDAAAAAGGEVWVQSGIYPERITLRRCAYVYGGFAGTETRREERDWSSRVTTLDGGRAGTVVTADSLAYRLAAIDGFTIHNGKATEGGGVRCYGGAPTIANSSIVDNSADSGGGIWCLSSSATITNSVMEGNIASASGGGIYCSSGSPVLTKNTIRANAASAGGGIYARYLTSATMADNLLVGNSATTGGGLWCSGSAVRIANSTIVGNTAGMGGGIHWTISSFSEVTIANTVIAFNTPGIYVTITGSGMALSFRHTCVHGNGTYDYWGMTNPVGTKGNVSADPLFVRLANRGLDGTWGTADDDYGDLRLLPGSPCIDAGSNADVPADSADLDTDGNTAELLPIDLAGAARFSDDPYTLDAGAGIAPIVDIGAYELRLADANGDGYVDVVDLLGVVYAFGTVAGDPTYDATCDFNADGAVDVADLLDIVYNFGT